MKKTVNLGKIDLYGTGRRYPADIEIELRKRGGEDTFIIKDGEKVYTGEKTPVYTELSICGTVWNTVKSDCIMAGQCLDHMAEYIKTPTFKKLFRWWKLYHLNDMHAGTPEQEKCINEYLQKNGIKYSYELACDILKEYGLYEVPFYGKTVGKEYNGELYKYGHGWIVNDIPENDLDDIINFINS